MNLLLASKSELLFLKLPGTGNVVIKKSTIRNIMRIGFLSVALFITASLQLLFGSPVRSQTVDDVTVHIGLNNVTLVQAFHKIEAQTSFRFMYRKEEVQKVKNIEVGVGSRTVGELLRTILSGTSLTYREINNQVLIMIVNNKNPIVSTEYLTAPILPKYRPRANIVKGRVVDINNEPLSGVSVTVKGTQTGTLTDENGEYSLDVPATGTIVFSFVGFATQEVAVNGRSVINLKLTESASELEQVVVVGYTTLRQKNLTGAISSVKGDELTAIPMGDAQKQLQGKVSGVTITTSGQPGGQSSVRIRGFGSFTSNDPLYVVDGVPTNDISNIDPNDISDISVLKDAAAASIYGARAFAGVILVTTKKGAKGSLTVNYDGSYGWQFPGHGWDMLDPQQTAEWTWNAIKAVGGTPSNPQYGSGATPILPDYLMAGNNYGLLNSDPGTAALVDPALYNMDPAIGPFYQIVKANKSGTNWYQELTRVAPIQTHNLGLSGGNDNSKYNIQFGYFNQQGVVMETYLKRYTIRANTEFTIHNRVRIGENIQLGLRENPGLGNGDIGGNEGNAIGMSYRENPLIPVHDIMGNFAGTRAVGFNNPQNPVANQYRTRNNSGRTAEIFGNMFADILLPYNVTFHSSFGGGYSNYYYNNFSYLQYENAENNPTTNFVLEGANYIYNWVWTNTVQMDQQYGDHHLKILLGQESLGGQARNIDASGFGPFSADPIYATISTTQSNGRVVTDGGGHLPTTYSLFAQINYNYKEKYLFGGTIRRDGAAVFGPQKRFGVFPAASLGWRISDESFMAGASWINDLKIRGSYGEMGNSTPVPLINQFNTFATSPEAASYDIYGTSNSLAEGLRPNGFGAPSTHWETNKTLDFGVDGTFFNNSLEVTVDWYNRKTSGLLFAPQVEATVGFLNSYPTINVGSMKNNGLDIQINKRGNFSSFWRYNAGVIFSTYRNEVTKVSNDVNYFYGSNYGSGRIPGQPTINIVGAPMSSFYGYQIVGLWQSQAEIDEADKKAQQMLGDPTATYMEGGERPGEFRYADVDGSGFIGSNDRKIIGNPNPDFTYGVNGSIGYKNFDLLLDFYGVWGQDLFNYTKWFTDFYASFPGGAVSKRVLNSWTPQNTNTDIPIFEDRAGLSTNQAINSYYIENGSYFRLRNIQLSYKFSGDWMKRIGIQKFRCYVQAINLFTITKYDGLDPAISGLDNTFGVDYGSYPFVKQFILGANITF